VANLSMTLHINFYQNRSSIEEVMIKKFWCVFLCLTVYIYIIYLSQLLSSLSSAKWQVYDILFRHRYISKAAVWLSGNIVGRINKVTLHRAGLVLRWVTICRYTVLLSNQPTRLTQPGHPSAGRCNEYWRWLWPLGKKRRVLRSSRPCYQDCWVDTPTQSVKGAGC